jgi:hypothetical protein
LLLQPELAIFSWDMLDARLAQALRMPSEQEMAAAIRALAVPVAGARDVYALPVLSAGFMGKLLREFAHAHSLPVKYTPPNTMNHYGLTMAELGLRSLFRDMVALVLQPLAAQLLPLDAVPGPLNSHHAFSIRYRLGEDIALDRHMDLSQVAGKKKQHKTKQNKNRRGKEGKTNRKKRQKKEK